MAQTKEAQTPTKKKKPSYTRRIVEEIENNLRYCLFDNRKLNENAVFDIIDFLYKSLRSCQDKAIFERIAFKSRYVCIVFDALNKVMIESLLDLSLFNTKHKKLDISLHDIINEVINKNIITSDEVNAKLYKQNIMKLKNEMKIIKDQPHIIKLIDIHKEIR